MKKILHDEKDSLNRNVVILLFIEVALIVAIILIATSCMNQLMIYESSKPRNLKMPVNIPTEANSEKASNRTVILP